MLQRVARASALCGAGAAALFGVLLLPGALPLQAAWAVAQAIVILAMLCVGGFAWIVLTLPRGAPWRRNGLRVGAALLGVAFVGALVSGAATGLSAGVGAVFTLAGALLVRER